MLGRTPSRLLAALLLSLGIAACGGGGDDGAGGGRIKSNPDNQGVEITIGSEDSTEQQVLAEIYSQALEAAGYTVETDTGFPSAQEARQATESGRISGYPDYLTSPAQDELQAQGLVGFEPAPYNRTSAIGLLVSTADRLGVEQISDLKGKSRDLSVAGPPECEGSSDCLAGVEDAYGLEFAEFVPTGVDERYEVLDDETADLSILSSTDPELFADPLVYTILNDDEGVFPTGNPVFIASRTAVDEAGPDFQGTIERVEKGLDLEQVQELKALVEIDGERPAPVAREYLQEFGFIPD